MKRSFFLIIPTAVLCILLPSCQPDSLVSVVNVELPGETVLTTDSSDAKDSSVVPVTGSADVDPYNEEDYVDTYTPEGTVSIVFSEGGAQVSGDTSLVGITTDGAGVTVNNPDGKSLKYVLSGSSSNGYFKLYSTRKQAIELSGLTLTNPSGAAINNQSKKRTFIILSGDSSLADGTSYNTPSGEDEKAAFFSEGQLCFSGSGSLTVTAKGKAGITSDDYLHFLEGTVSVSSSGGHGIRGKDAVIVSDGTVSSSVSADMKKAVSTDGFYLQDGGTVTLSATGSAAYDSDDSDISAAGCIKADGNFIMNGGSLTCTSTGKGAKCISVDGRGYFCGGSIDARASGASFYYQNDHSYPKALKFDGAVIVGGGVTYASSAAHEAFTTDSTWTQSGGVVIAEAKDDAVNSAGQLTVRGGYLRGTSTGNDGIDANAAILIEGGVVIGEGTTAPECGIDSVEGTYVTVNGGYVISRGGSIGPFNTTGGKAFVSSSIQGGATVGLSDSDGRILSYQTPSSGGTSVLFSAPSLTQGGTYYLVTDPTSISLANSNFPRFGLTFAGGSSGQILTASSSVQETGGGMGGFGGGGFGGGGGPFGGR